MLSLHALKQDCVKEYRRYADTVAVLSAIYQVCRKNPQIISHVGIEQSLQNNEGNDVTPDIVALGEANTKGLVIEFKSSLPFSEPLLEKEIKKIRRYAIPCLSWKNPTGKVDYHDVILVCHFEDAERTVDMIRKVSLEKDYDFLAHDGFALWAWSIGTAKAGEGKEHLIIYPSYGKPRNADIENMIKPTGLVLPEESLTYLRCLFTFTREKPPIHYTIAALIQNVFSSFQDPTKGREIYKLGTDLIYQRANIFWPSWHLFDQATVQVKRRWISEALETMFALGLIGKPIGEPDSWLVPIPTLKSREPVQMALCTMLAKRQLKATERRRPRGRPRTTRPQLQPHPKMKKLEDFF